MVLVMPLLLLLSQSFTAADLPEADFVVAPDGNDGNPGSLEAPFATIQRAQEAVRGLLAQGLDNNVTVFLREGEYVLEQPLVFGPADSGTANFIVRYAAYPGETPVLSGGRRLTGWTKGENNQWTLNVA